MVSDGRGGVNAGGRCVGEAWPKDGSSSTVGGEVDVLSEWREEEDEDESGGRGEKGGQGRVEFGGGISTTQIGGLRWCGNSSDSGLCTLETKAAEQGEVKPILARP